jgi:hypothetical protein
LFSTVDAVTVLDKRAANSPECPGLTSVNLGVADPLAVQPVVPDSKPGLESRFAAASAARGNTKAPPVIARLTTVILAASQ